MNNSSETLEIVDDWNLFNRINNLKMKAIISIYNTPKQTTKKYVILPLVVIMWFYCNHCLKDTSIL